MVDFLSQEKSANQIDNNTPYFDARKEGDFYLEKAILVSFDGKEYGVELIRTSIEVYEDLFNNTMSGTIQFIDSSDLVQFLPLIGQETLKLRFTRPSETGRGLLDEYFDMEFRIYKMDGREPDSDKMNTQTFTLHFTSKERINDIKQKVYQIYDGMPYSSMVEKICQEYLKTSKGVNVEPTMYDQHFMARGYSPFQTIGIISSKSISAENNGSAYLFYEDNQNYNFVTIGKLLKQEPIQKYISQLANVLEGGDNKYRDRTIEEDFRKVEKYTFKGSFDILKNMQSGMYAQRLIAVDMVSQSHQVIDWDYKKEFGRLPKLHNGDICTSDLDALGSPITTTRLAVSVKEHPEDPSMRANHVEEYLLTRACQLQQTAGNRIVVTFSGDPRRKVGQVIEFLVPNHYGSFSKDHPPDPPHDRYLAGKFLITALKHRISASSYFCSAELMKDSFSQDIEGVDVIEQQDFSY